jgi:hypothetical protein
MFAGEVRWVVGFAAREVDAKTDELTPIKLAGPNSGRFD